jgi:DNA-binding transcriptional MocR family regulator
MKKNEWVYREILHGFIEKGERLFTQRTISLRCGVSLGNVNKAVYPLEKMNAIEKKPRGFIVINWKKLLLYWASSRNLERDVVYSTRVDMGVKGIERSLPNVVFTAYSGYKLVFKAVPADYSEVVVYGDEREISERFGKKEGKANLVVLKADPHLRKFRKAPLAQIYVDLWNLGTWYADDFIREMDRRMENIIEKRG